MSFLSNVELALQNIKANLRSRESVEEFFSEHIVMLLHKAILTGEYYKCSAARIESIQNLFTAITVDVKVGKSIPWVGNRAALLELITNRFKRYFRLFADLSKRLKENLSHYNSDKERKIFDIGIYEDYYLKEEMADVTQKDLASDSIYRINILLAYLDEYLECTENIRSKLVHIGRFLDEKETLAELEPIITALKSKVEFLQFKIEYREKHNIGGSLPQIEVTNKYYSFYRDVQDHYRDLSYVEVIQYKDWVRSFSVADPSNFKLAPFHHLNRYLSKKREAKGLMKHIKRSNLQEAEKEAADLLKILEVEKSKPEYSKLTLFDRIAFMSVENLLYDTSLAIELELIKENDFENIGKNISSYLLTGENEDVFFLREYLERIKKFSNQKGKIHDFYCFIVFLKFLNKMIDYFKSNPQLVINMVTPNQVPLDLSRLRINDMIMYLRGIYKETLIEFNRALDLLVTYKVLPAYLSINECDTKGRELDNSSLFLRSSYVLPNNFMKIRNKVNYWEILLNAQLNALKNSFEIEFAKNVIGEKVIENEKKLNEGIAAFEVRVQKNEKKFSGDVADFNKKVKDNEIKLVQIVAMFVSIATFVLINVKIFDNKGGLESFGIILGLAACFFSFNIFFHYMFLSQVKSGQGPDKEGEKPSLKAEKNFWIFWKDIKSYVGNHPGILVPVFFALVSLIILICVDGKNNEKLKSLDAEIHRLDSLVKQKAVGIIPVSLTPLTSEAEPARTDSTGNPTDSVTSAPEMPQAQDTRR
jgi:hypothetical protein